MNAHADFNGFLRQLSPKLKGIVFKLNRGFASLDGQDLFQEASLFLWEHFQSGDFSDKTESYILQGCYFHLQNFIRLSKDRFHRVRIETDTDDDSCYNELIVLTDGGPEEFLDGLNSKLLAEVICNNGLTDREKAFLPFFAQGLTAGRSGLGWERRM
jgi:DNA-directed RNA polymerase specialized sigma24 family protein